VKGMGLKPTGRLCDDAECGGPLHDLTYDWDTDLPPEEFKTAEDHFRRANLCLCLGTSLRIRPAGNLPMKTVRLNGKAKAGDLVIVNLQRTHLDDKASIRIFAPVDKVMRMLMDLLGEDILKYPVSDKAESESGKTARTESAQPGKRKQHPVKDEL